MDMAGSGSFTTFCLVNSHMHLFMEFKDNGAAAKSVVNNNNNTASTEAV